ncbi:MAG: FeoB-associated Cys-rich membrane protein [Lachnospiraceae bacterium]|nr:FeoB-associated Cys-rich membrane protein [Lachnospiraceae bacterium]
MNAVLADMIIVLILIAALFAACRYIYKEKKKGRHCIGCPMAGSCPRHGACQKQVHHE